MDERMTAFVEAFGHDPILSRLPLPGAIRKHCKLPEPENAASIGEAFSQYLKSSRQMVSGSEIIDGTVVHKDVKFPELTYETRVKYPEFEVKAETKFEEDNSPVLIAAK